MCTIQMAIIGGMVLQAGTAIMQGQAANTLAKHNAALSRQRAKAVRQRGVIETARLKTSQRLLAGTQLVQGKKSGITTSGSPLEVMAFQANQDELDLMLLDYETELAARGHLNQASAQRFEGRLAATAGLLKAGSSITSGYIQGRELGVFGGPSKAS